MRVALSILYPLVILLILRYFDIGLDKAFILKLYPLAMSCYITFLLWKSYKNEGNFILDFVKRFSKKTIDTKEEEYIKKSTLFWLVLSLTNVSLHVMFLLHVNVYYWALYSSFGWYGVFIFGGLGQFLHRKFVYM